MRRVRLVRGDIDAAVIDPGLPDRSGDVLINELRTFYPTLPIVVASGHEEADLRERFKNESRIVFLNKPFTQEQLLAKLRAVQAIELPVAGDKPVSE